MPPPHRDEERCTRAGRVTSPVDKQAVVSEATLSLQVSGAYREIGRVPFLLDQRSEQRRQGLELGVFDAHVDFHRQRETWKKLQSLRSAAERLKHSAQPLRGVRTERLSEFRRTVHTPSSHEHRALQHAVGQVEDVDGVQWPSQHKLLVAHS
jgi:hypothetical protein